MLDRLRHATDLTKFKADQILRVNRVQNEIGTIRREVQLARDRIAGAALDVHHSGQALPIEIEQLCVAVDRLNAQIMEREAVIAAIQAEPAPQLTTPTVSYGVQSPTQSTLASGRPTQTCPQCGFGAPVQAAFCPNCGKAIPKPTESQSSSANDPAMPAEGGAATSSEPDTPNVPDDQGG